MVPHDGDLGHDGGGHVALSNGQQVTASGCGTDEREWLVGHLHAAAAVRDALT